MAIGDPQSPAGVKPQADSADSTFAGGLVGAGAPPGDARMRLPREPYPGLRPFLDFEAALLFGRERQVREVIEGLSQSQFVAVLGGSGSGKSSLIHAGVVPELRSFGIPGAGDLWLPMTCTPGTNVSDEDKAAQRRSPVTRLARRFARLLKSRGSEFADRARLDEIAGVFRQEAGFARLVDTYAREFYLPPGPDPEESRVLFVLDQFEEVFHPTNRDVADARLLVERVLDHFFNPHPRCHVVITMRSEHLNDCAAFLELPDAINKSSYLIRRLDSDELRDAIVGPAQRFLRLVARSETSTRPLPSEVVFEPAVLQRLLRDVQAITSDPDHLPLLQHLLARLWEAALQREEMDTLVPATITEIDLVRAVNAGGRRGDEVPLVDELNTLRACVNNWPESIYGWHDAAGRAQLDALFRNLAFKDPNTGAYSQQRVDVDEAAKRLGTAGGRDDLRSLIAEGFLGSVDYLFWDDDDPARVTLKVSHESFIRGWLRFRSLVDTESLQFDEYLLVLRKCGEWTSNNRSEDYLLEAGEMRRLGGSGFVARTQQGHKRESWLRLLAMDRDAVHLAQVAGELDAYLQASEKRLALRRQRETRGRRTVVAAVALAVVSALLPMALSGLVQGPTMGRAQLLFEAGNRANHSLLKSTQFEVGDPEAAATLQSLLIAAERVDEARSGGESWRMRVSRQVLERAGSWPVIREQREFLDSVFGQSEPTVNAVLRQLMQSVVWRAGPVGTALMPGAVTVAAPEHLPGVTCGAAPQAPGSAVAAGNETGGLTGDLYVQGRKGANALSSDRAVFVPARTAGERGPLEVFSAQFDRQTGACTRGDPLMDWPGHLNASVLIDATLRHYYSAVDAPSAVGQSLIVQQLDWQFGPGQRLVTFQRLPRSVVNDPVAIAAVRTAAGPGRVGVAATSADAGSLVIALPEKRWRLVASEAQPVSTAAIEAGQLVPLTAAAKDSACGLLSASFAGVDRYAVRVFEHEGRCFRMAQGRAHEDAAAAVPQEVLVAVYDRPGTAARLRTPSPAPVASLLPFARFSSDPQRAMARRWWVGVSGPWDGWLFSEVGAPDPDNAGQALQATAGAGSVMPPQLLAAPWSTCALWHLGLALQRNNAAPASPATTPSRLDSTCQR